MGIKLTEHSTIIGCDICGAQIETARADGVVPVEWGTGHLWIDVSLSEQLQRALCFCPTCKPVGPNDITLALRAD